MRTNSTTKRAALSGATLVVTLGIMLAGCSGQDEDTAVDSSSSPTSAATAEGKTAVSDKALGAALLKLVYQGESVKSTDGGKCLAESARHAGLSDTALQYVVETNGDDQGAVIEGLHAKSKQDAEILFGTELRDQFDACVDAGSSASASDGGGETAYPTPATPTPSAKQDKPDLTPKYPDAAGQDIISSSQLKDGVVSMFSSFAQDADQKKTYQQAGTCLSDAIFQAGFSQKSLQFIAGGAPIGTGSIAENLKTDEDKQLWESQEFKTQLIECTTNPTSEDSAGS